MENNILIPNLKTNRKKREKTKIIISIILFLISFFMMIQVSQGQCMPDVTSPMVVCNPNVSVNLNNFGIGCISYSNIDMGSTDLCTQYNQLEFKLRRMSATNFQDTICFRCNDLGQPIMVVMQVKDASNNVSSCMVPVTVLDKNVPTLTCPVYKTINCNDDLSQSGLKRFGSARINDDPCNLSTLDSTFVYNLTNCNVGTIERKFYVVKAGIRLDSCSQIINVVRPPSTLDIIFPKDTTVLSSSCITPVNFDTSNLQNPYKQPIITNDDVCSIPGISYLDQLFSINYPSCYKIMRTWTVKDWCSPNASYTHVQLLIVMDTTKPVLTCPADRTVSTTNECNIVQVNNLTATASDCGPINIKNISNYSTNKGSDASGRYPTGTHTIKFMANDACGNMSNCEFNITVKDLMAPSIVCQNVSCELATMTNGIAAMVPARLLIASMNDNCTAKNLLKVTIRKKSVNPITVPTDTIINFNCSDLGDQIVEVWVTDLNGNSDYCTAKINVQNNMNLPLCPPILSPVFVANGIIKNNINEGVEDVQVNVLTSNNNMYQMTNQIGGYKLSNLTQKNTYTFTPIKNNGLLNGVTTLDILLINRHILGIEKLLTPSHLIAADVNHSGNITTLDMLEIRKAILRKTTSFTNNNSWRFIQKDFTFPLNVDPLTVIFPEKVIISNIKDSLVDVDFMGIKIGDINNSSVPNTQLTNTVTSRSTNELFFINEKVTEGQEIEIPIYLENLTHINGMQLGFTFDASNFEFKTLRYTMLSLLDFNTSNFYFDKNVLRISWNNTSGMQMEGNIPLFYISGIVKRNMDSKDLMQLENDFDQEIYNGTNVTKIQLTSKENKIENSKFNLYQNKPNPFSENTMVEYTIPQNENIVFSVYDINGKRIFENKEYQLIGKHRIELDQKLFTNNGIYYYKLETMDNTATRKMIYTK
jgi:hypothetical protein